MTPRRSMEEPLYDDYPVKGGQRIHAGTIVGVKDGLAFNPTTVTGPFDFYVFARYGANGVGLADGEAVLERAEFRSSYLFNVSGGLTRANLGDNVFLVDNQTVAKTGDAEDLCGSIVFLDENGVTGATDGGGSPGTESAYIQLNGPLRK